MFCFMKTPTTPHYSPQRLHVACHVTSFSNGILCPFLYRQIVHRAKFIILTTNMHARHGRTSRLHALGTIATAAHTAKQVAAGVVV